MGRLLRKIAMRAGTQVLSPIPELPEESRSPTPVSAGAFNASPKRPENPKLSEEECFMKHLQSLAADYKKEMEQVGRQLRVMQRRNARIEKNAEFYHVEYDNYKWNWDKNQEKILGLKTRLDKYKPLKKVIDRLHSLQDENKRLRASYFQTVLDNNFLRKTWKNMEGEEIEDEEFPDVENVREAIAPRPPTAPDNGRAGSARRRPYTGRSRADRPHLPPITENNKTVTPHKQTTVESHEKKQSKSPVHLPQLGTMVPTPPTCPRRNAPSRRQSRIPLALPPIRGATSVDSLRLPRQGVQDIGRKSRDLQGTRVSRD
ncbi:uncharacterized protein LOC124139171 [Haliotis rufescens]|uniref:uncharacterized protein LOC124139171 n=1 Tax=Haliotis rufescens TaxID=6454 RepID=UPI00201FA543|nr:uncharacterized protein LOC124139171 [Haliotis rufescens]